MCCLCEGIPKQCKSAYMTLCLACCLSVLPTHALLSHKHLRWRNTSHLTSSLTSNLLFHFLDPQLELPPYFTHCSFLMILGRINYPIPHVLAHLFIYLQHVKLQVTVLPRPPTHLPRDSELSEQESYLLTPAW